MDRPSMIFSRPEPFSRFTLPFSTTHIRHNPRATQMYSKAIIGGLMVFLSLVLILAPILLLAMIFLIPFCPDSECEGYWKRFPFLLLQVLAIPVGFFIITMFIVVYQLRGYLSEHFEEYRCSPWMMPFVSWIRPDVSVTDNFEQCLGNISRVVQSAMMSPMIDIADELNGGQNIQADNVQKIQASLSSKQHTTLQIFHGLNNQMGALQAIGKTLMIKLGAIFNNVMTIVFDMYYALLSLASFYEAIICTPQVVLYVGLVAGSVLTGIGGVGIGVGGYEIDAGVTQQVIGEAILEVAADMPLAAPELVPEGTALQISGRQTMRWGIGEIIMFTPVLITGAVFTALFGFFHTNLKESTANYNAAITQYETQLRQQLTALNTAQDSITS